MRIVSLLPSTTEIVFDLGLADQLRGVTVECNWPQHAKEGREIVVDTFTNPTMTPGEIDAIVKERVAQGLDLYNLDDAALARCEPDLILSQDLCRVCAVASGDVNAAVARLNCDANVLQIDPQTLHQVINSINTIAEAAGVASRGTALTNSLHARLEKVADNVRGLARPKVFVLEWIDPPFGAGHWVPDIISAAGGEPLVCRPGERSVQTTWQEIADAQPDVVIVAPCGFGLDGASEQAASIINQLPNSVSVWAIDADSVMVRPGPRLVDGVEAIAAMLHGQPINETLLRRIR
ncbi:MAG: ABC transporter substrate-binding protein [Actinobacteria bacterium]|nr:ABC transporter substrate-binding protein [Actinomycetota bacterium]